MIKAIFLDFSRTIVKSSGLNAGPDFVGRGDIYRNLWRDYSARKINEEQLAADTLRLWQGVRTADLPTIKSGLQYTAGVKEVIPVLAQYGITSVLVSNVPSLLGRLFADELKINFVTGAEMEVVDGAYTGVVEKMFPTKGEVVREFKMRLQVLPEECAAVGDAYVDIEMFREVGLGVAFTQIRSDPEVVKAARYVIDDFRELIPLIDSAGRQKK